MLKFRSGKKLHVFQGDSTRMRGTWDLMAGRCMMIDDVLTFSVLLHDNLSTQHGLNSTK